MRRLFGLFALLLAGGPSAAQAAAPAATLDADTLPASAEGATLLHVRTAGRFAITAQSASFTALDLVDMITGPTPLAGAAGSKDGRLDLLLDTGTYKLRTHPAQNATGRVALHVAPFTPAGDTEIAPQRRRRTRHHARRPAAARLLADRHRPPGAAAGSRRPRPGRSARVAQRTRPGGGHPGAAPDRADKRPPVARFPADGRAAARTLPGGRLWRAEAALGRW